jgi:hypothetical protein
VWHCQQLMGKGGHCWQLTAYRLLVAVPSRVGLMAAYSNLDSDWHGCHSFISSRLVGRGLADSPGSMFGRPQRGLLGLGLQTHSAVW